MPTPMVRWELRDVVLESATPLVMGIVNVTPDSFSDGGKFDSSEAAVAHGRTLAAQGADLVDVGGESTRPGAAEIPVGTEMDRILPVVQQLSTEGIRVSVDTSKPEVAVAAVEAGAQVINDVTGFRSAEMRAVAAETEVGVVAMHMAGSPRTMQANPTYGDVVDEVASYLSAQAALLEESGVAPDRICVDPGIGFGKTVDHNLSLLRETERLAGLGYRLMIGASRKRFLGEVAGIDVASERDRLTAVLSGMVGMLGADIVRVHDVAATKEAVLLSSAIVSST